MQREQKLVSNTIKIKEIYDLAMNGTNKARTKLTSKRNTSYLNCGE